MHVSSLIVIVGPHCRPEPKRMSDALLIEVRAIIRSILPS
jgi:hypothetical protein